MKAATAKLASPSLTIPATGLLAFVVGALSKTTVNIIGNLYLSEIIALIGVIIVGAPTIMRRTMHQTVIISGLTLVLVGLVLADIQNATAPSDMLRGWANPVFSIISILFLVNLFTRNERAILFWLAGAALARIVIVDQDQISEILAESNGFKARIAPVLIPVFLIVAFQISRFAKNANILLFATVGFAFVFLGARSDGLFFLATAAVMSMMLLKRGAQRYAFASILIAMGYILYIAYVEYTLKSGQISNSFNQLSRAQNPYNPFELLRQGRSEAFVALAAVRDAPLLGHGSWAKDTFGNYSELLSLIKGWNNVNYSTIIVSHSVLLTAWLWGGIIALTGVLMMYVSSARRAIAVIRHLDLWRPILIFLLIQTSWHFLFSPFGHIRTSFPFFIAATIALAQRNFPDRKGP